MGPSVLRVSTTVPVRLIARRSFLAFPAPPRCRRPESRGTDRESPPRQLQRPDFLSRNRPTMKFETAAATEALIVAMFGCDRHDRQSFRVLAVSCPREHR